MMKYIFAVMIVLSLIGAGVLWFTNIVIKAERAETLGKAVDLVQERDRLNVKARNATADDICRRLGGVVLEDGTCQ